MAASSVSLQALGSAFPRLSSPLRRGCAVHGRRKRPTPRSRPSCRPAHGSRDSRAGDIAPRRCATRQPVGARGLVVERADQTAENRIGRSVDGFEGDGGLAVGATPGADWPVVSQPARARADARAAQQVNPRLHITVDGENDRPGVPSLDRTCLPPKQIPQRAILCAASGRGRPCLKALVTAFQGRVQCHRGRFARRTVRPARWR